MSANPFHTERLDHLGIVAGICDEIDLVARIDAAVPSRMSSPTVGQAVKAMVLNALGFVGRPLYLTSEFYETKPVELLVGEGLSAADLNDHNLGRALEALFRAGITEVFTRVAQPALSTFGVEIEHIHLDSTSFNLHGEYKRKDSPSADEDAPQAVTITHGYSKDHRPDLKQAMLNLMCANNSTLPVWIQALSGNTSDTRSFPEAVNAYTTQLKANDERPLFVMDAAVYSQDNLPLISQNDRWISRVPATLSAVNELRECIQVDEMQVVDEDTAIWEHGSYYGGIKQRWLVVHHRPTAQKALKTFHKKVQRDYDAVAKSMKRLQKQVFNCEADAQQALVDNDPSSTYHQVTGTILSRERYARAGRPTVNTPTVTEWYLQLTIKRDEPTLARRRNRLGTYVLATNVLDTQSLSNEALVRTYRQQSTSVERGFRFLKDPLFFAHTQISPQLGMSLTSVRHGAT
jgi:transposase